MANFLRLCLNESIKILKKKSTLIFGIIIFISLFLCYIFANFIIEQNFYYENDSELLENDNVQKKMIENMKVDIIKVQNNKEALYSSKAFIEYYQYATDNNIHLFVSHNADIMGDYWKSNIIYKLIEFKKQWYKLQDSKDDPKKLEAVNKEIESLTKMLQNDDYNKYLDLKEAESEEQYKNGKITVYQRDIAIYIFELNRKYEITRYNDSSNWWKYNSIYRIQQAKSMLNSSKYSLSFDEKNKLSEELNL